MQSSSKYSLKVFGAVIVALILAIAMVAFAGCSCSQQPSSNSSDTLSVSDISQPSAKGAPANTQIQVPNLVQLEQHDATKLLANVGLKLGEVKQEYSNDIARGHVMAQDPEPLKMVDAGTVVTITVSKGKEAPAQVQVPDLIGMSQTDAEKALRDVKLVAVQGDPIMTDSVAPGKVCKQSVQAGTTVNEGSQISFSTALASNTAKVPNLIGEMEADARQALDEAGLGCDTTSTYSSSVAAGAVMDQSFAAGTKVTKGTVVTINISLGAKPADKVKVPDITTYTLNDAIEALNSCGLNYRYTGEQDGTVSSVSPAPGTEVDVGSTVSFTLQHVSSLVNVPDVAGLDGPSAESAMDAVGLDLSYDTANPDRKISSTNPAAGTLVDSGSRVQAIYDKEDTKVAIPDVAGLNGRDAAAELDAVGLVLNYDTDNPDKALIGTTPAAGEKVEKGSSVDANYPENPTVDVPDVSGMTGEEAAQTLSDVGLSLKYDEKHPQRTVQSTNPAAGQSVEAGTVVEAVYPDKVEVPDISNMNGPTAEEACVPLGLTLDYDKDNPDRVISGSNPAAGKTVKAGTTVTAIYDEPEPSSGSSAAPQDDAADADESGADEAPNADAVAPDGGATAPDDEEAPDAS